MSVTTITGFFRCRGFDHLVRFVTDVEKNKYEQSLVIFQDGHRVIASWEFTGEVLPLDQLSTEVGGSWNRSEQWEFRTCEDYIKHVTLKLDDPSLFDTSWA